MARSIKTTDLDGRISIFEPACPEAVFTAQLFSTEDKLKYTPSWVKVKYGAWYLSPKTWKARPKEEPLQDPKEQQDKALSESKKKSHKLDSVLATMHGAKAFKDFVDKKSTRVPEFLQVVAEAQQSENKANETATEEGTERRRSRGQTITSQS